MASSFLGGAIFEADFAGLDFLEVEKGQVQNVYSPNVFTRNA